MAINPKEQSKYSAGPQALGYLYQLRYALYKVLQLPEPTSVYIERHDDVEFVYSAGTGLTSLKHKAKGDRVGSLSIDFWKSIQIWLERYSQADLGSSDIRFLLITTSQVSADSNVSRFLPNSPRIDTSFVNQLIASLDKSKAQVLKRVKAMFLALSEDDRIDFVSRIVVFDSAPRITDLPEKIMEGLKGIRREFRKPVFERLEGWWWDQAIKLIDGGRTNPISGYEISDHLAAVAEEYKNDNLSINFRGKSPPEGVNAEQDDRLFVEQLRHIGVDVERIRTAILDYYRAFEQRSLWAREGVLVGNEVEEYEARLEEEWSRYRAVVIESLPKDASAESCVQVGKEIYRWAEFNTGHLRIRERVTEPYVVRGGFHILANVKPRPRVHWHPKFLESLKGILAK